MTDLADIVYFSARKLSSSRGGGICTNEHEIYRELEPLIPLYEGFLTYGGFLYARSKPWPWGYMKHLTKQ